MLITLPSFRSEGMFLWDKISWKWLRRPLFIFSLVWTYLPHVAVKLIFCLVKYSRNPNGIAWPQRTHWSESNFSKSCQSTCAGTPILTSSENFIQQGNSSSQTSSGRDSFLSTHTMPSKWGESCSGKQTWPCTHLHLGAQSPRWLLFVLSNRLSWVCAPVFIS